MKTAFYPSNKRGVANHGWLQSKHSFSFASFFDPERIRFGSLRVINQDRVAPGMGFGEHPHSNMEIISIPYKGALKHRDSAGNAGVIKTGEVQVMSAGLGIQHSEMNASNSEDVEFLQIWIHPNMNDVPPRYQQSKIPETFNKLQRLVSPQGGGGAVWIHQNAHIFQLQTNKAVENEHELMGENRLAYIFVVEGSIKIAEQELKAGDAMGISETQIINYKSESGSKVLFFDLNSN